MNPIVYAIPVFFLLMALEWVIAWRRGQRAYRLGDTIHSVGLGAISQLSGVYARGISLGVYLLAYETLRLWTLPQDAWWVWLAGLLLYDFLYYWHHRLGHECALFWAAHVVHHQSEDFNLGTALRQTSSGFLFGWIFYLPMAVLGFPPLVFISVALIDLLYQYWIHTEQIRRLGWFDRVFASPSNHRVHHAINERYLDRNYGGILIVWDRIFGSFQEELDQDPPVYGTRKPLRSHDPLWANLEVYAALLRQSLALPRWRDKLLTWFKPPGWQPGSIAIEARSCDPGQQVKFDPPMARSDAPLAFLAFVSLIAAGTHWLAAVPTLSEGEALAYALWTCGGLWMLGRWTQSEPAAGLLLGLAVTSGAGWNLAHGTWFGDPLPPYLLTSIASGVAALGLAIALRAGSQMLARPAQPA